MTQRICILILTLLYLTRRVPADNKSSHCSTTSQRLSTYYLYGAWRGMRVLEDAGIHSAILYKWHKSSMKAIPV